MNLQENISLKPYNTFGIEAKAKYFTAFQSAEQLEEIISDPQLHNLKSSLLILGGGSNLLFTRNFDGLVLKNEVSGIEVIKEDEDFIYVKAGAGENWHQFVLYCLQHQYAGVENLSLIPGNVGASPMQNIGAYGVEIKDVFYELEAFHLGDKAFRKFSLSDCAFGYRESVFKREYKNQFVITSVTYRLRKQPVFNTSYGAIRHELDKMGVKELSIQVISQAVINIRSSKLPDWKIEGNAGSFFKNPQIPNEQFQSLKEQFPKIVAFPVDTQHTKLAAGWLIEQCGWKGYRKGDAGCYPKQALVLVNYGNAKGEEIFELSEQIVQSVKNKFGVELEREVNII
ncbi:UDP-N-acetylmuramate dehydrogenase [Chitinophagaceae bacterium LB-8]|uniref:UDP-N-acetylenolpyruvoylglucosamine reductase n=1 Tax=Paraflavisolibacter caeni TaxID=2982496 RepID=A0A9X3BJF7_9BACT|nr:UDP-N-acetylmuramate dehydrogenase [Paraflavisolibacter caeni]MCU7551138.1 UDP-N-acetylmuramate dehydrogenase [Paraflavisolibacter caeni]